MALHMQSNNKKEFWEAAKRNVRKCTAELYDGLADHISESTQPRFLLKIKYNVQPHDILLKLVEKILVIGGGVILKIFR